MGQRSPKVAWAKYFPGVVPERCSNEADKGSRVNEAQDQQSTAEVQSEDAGQSLPLRESMPPARESLIPSPLRQGVRAPMLIASVCVCAFAVMEARPLLVPLLIAFFIGIVTTPAVTGLVRRGVPRGIAVFLGLAAAVLVLGGFAIFMGMAVGTLGERLPFYQERITAFVSEVSLWANEHGLSISAEEAIALADPGTLMQMVTKLFQSLAGLVSRGTMVMLVVGFFLVEAVNFRGKFEAVLPFRADRLSLVKAAGELRTYLMVKTATSAVTGLLAGLLCEALDVDLPVVWGLLAFLLNYIPTVGSVIAALPPVLLALLLHGGSSAAGVMIGYLAINFIIGNIFEPRVMGQALGLSPLVVFLSMAVWYWLLGPIGALFSGPLTMLVRVWLEHTEDLQWIAVLLGPALPVQEASTEQR